MSNTYRFNRLGKLFQKRSNQPAGPVGAKSLFLLIGGLVAGLLFCVTVIVFIVKTQSANDADNISTEQSVHIETADETTPSIIDGHPYTATVEVEHSAGIANGSTVQNAPPPPLGAATQDNSATAVVIKREIIASNPDDEAVTEHEIIASNPDDEDGRNSNIKRVATIMIVDNDEDENEDENEDEDEEKPRSKSKSTTGEIVETTQVIVWKEESPIALGRTRHYQSADHRSQKTIPIHVYWRRLFWSAV